ncbi:MAG: hypothetical protein HKO66_12635 [Saprospiraceae bacterium]|nr:hypothetical protein [Bacteroidia bacterium]NNE13547.1 hypothetical protein [Saprospiraceae bacterium]NNL93077.1 hypothetical protein [Saprospiraceae bacterium]
MDTEFLDSNINQGDLIITNEIRKFLKETAKWAKFLSIIGFIIIGLMIIIGLFMGTAMATMMGGMTQETGMSPLLGGGFFTVFYILLAALYIMPVLFLYRYASNMKVALENNNQQFLSDSFRNLKSHYKYIGILMAILLILYGGVFILGLLFAMMAG